MATKLADQFEQLETTGKQCYETLRKRQYRAKNRGWWEGMEERPIRYDGYAFLVGVYDAEKYMFDNGFAMTKESLRALEERYMWELGVVDYLKIRNIDLTYLAGVRAALKDGVVFEDANDIELC